MEDLPDQHGRTVVVTGASAGLGLESTRALAARGATVVLATRDAAKTDAAVARVRRAVPDARLERVTLDLADLGSVRRAASELRTRFDRLDVLLANAGLMATPYARTADGFELQLGVNHLGHAALTAALLPLLRSTPGSRIVVVSSQMHLLGRMRWHDLHWERGYRRWSAYAQSKLANLLYVQALQRRLDDAGADTIAVAAHPGYARTELQTKGPTLQGGWSGRWNHLASGALTTLVGQSAAQGALPQLHAATAPDVDGGSYWGPTELGGLRGAPGRAHRSDRAKDDTAAERLWAVTETLTGVRHTFG